MRVQEPVWPALGHDASIVPAPPFVQLPLRVAAEEEEMFSYSTQVSVTPGTDSRQAKVEPPAGASEVGLNAPPSNPPSASLVEPGALLPPQATAKPTSNKTHDSFFMTLQLSTAPDESAYVKGTTDYGMHALGTGPGVGPASTPASGNGLTIAGHALASSTSFVPLGAVVGG